MPILRLLFAFLGWEGGTSNQTHTTYCCLNVKEHRQALRVWSHVSILLVSRVECILLFWICLFLSCKSRNMSWIFMFWVLNKVCVPLSSVLPQVGKEAWDTPLCARTKQHGGLHHARQMPLWTDALAPGLNAQRTTSWHPLTPNPDHPSPAPLLSREDEATGEL